VQLILSVDSRFWKDANIQQTLILKVELALNVDWFDESRAVGAYDIILQRQLNPTTRMNSADDWKQIQHQVWNVASTMLQKGQVERAAAWFQ
jgi:hypothetical protein